MPPGPKNAKRTVEKGKSAAFSIRTVAETTSFRPSPRYFSVPRGYEAGGDHKTRQDAVPSEQRSNEAKVLPKQVE